MKENDIPKQEVRLISTTAVSTPKPVCPWPEFEEKLQQMSDHLVLAQHRVKQRKVVVGDVEDIESAIRATRVSPSFTNINWFS